MVYVYLGQAFLTRTYYYSPGPGGGIIFIVVFSLAIMLGLWVLHQRLRPLKRNKMNPVPNREPIKASTIAIISSIVLIVDLISLYIFSKSRLGVMLADKGFILNGLTIVILAIFPFFLRRDRRIREFIASALIPIIAFPCLYDFIYWYGTRYNLEPVLFYGNIVIIGLTLFPFAILNAKRQIQQMRENKLKAFIDNKKTLNFILPSGIEGVDDFKHNVNVQVELLANEIKFHELGFGKHSDNHKSVSLLYSQIIDADIAVVRERGYKYSEQLITYCTITYLNKYGDKKEIRFKSYPFFGNFNLFMDALKSQITDRSLSQNHTVL